MSAICGSILSADSNDARMERRFAEDENLLNLSVIKHSIFVVLVALPTLLFAAVQLAPGPAQAKATRLVSELVSNYHYNRPRLDDRTSSATLTRYLNLLDPNRQIFLASDIQSFEKFRYVLDDAMREADTAPAFEIYDVFRRRVQQRIDYAMKALDVKHDFNIDENFRIEYKDEPWMSSEKDLDELWRKRVKNDILNLKLAGKDAEKIKDTLRKRYQRILRRAQQQNTNDVYQLFINSYTNTIDPHTSYFSPRSSENFTINMSLSLEGIGAALRSKNEYTQVQRIIAGGPADLSGQIKAGDKIIGVAQDQTEMVDVIGWRLEDVVQLIRGPKGSVVRLLLQPYGSGVDGPSREITLVRDKIKLEEQAARSFVIDKLPGNPGVKLGVIEIPTFYLDFAARARGDEDYRSTTRDVRKLIRKLKEKTVDGIVIDLRGNGGGSLSEATELTGLFIKSGPVVQVKAANGDIEINGDNDPSIAYSGPLAVLVDANSASASEIFAGAIKDYGRGIIIGEPTFGKGTVQTLIDLNRFNNGKADLGQVKVTVAQFFRVNGDSTQHRGVRPDIVFPTVDYADDQGERSLDNALPWAKVKAANFEPVKIPWYDIEVLRNRDKSRVAKDPGFQYLVSVAKQIKEIRDIKEVSLLESKRRLERTRRMQKNLEMENLFRRSRGLEPLTLADKNKDDEDSFEEEKDDPINRIKLDEAANILADHITMLRGRYAARNGVKSLDGSE